MNLSDLVHRSTNGQHDHPIDSFFVPNSIHQQKLGASSSATIAETTTTATAAGASATNHPSLYDATVHSSAQALDGLPDTEQSYSATKSQQQHRHYVDHSLTTTTPTPTSPSQPKHASSSPLNQFYLSKTFFQPTSVPPPPSSSTTIAAATLSHLNPQQQQQAQEDHFVNKTTTTTTPLSSSPSSPSSSSLSSLIVDSHKVVSSKSSSSPLKQQQQQQYHVSKSKVLLSPKHQQESGGEEKTVETILPLDDEELLRRKRHSRLQPLTINGDNVTANNIEDGYIQFILHHDPDSIGDGIDSLMYVRRKFSSVPRTGDLSYTTWDVYVLVNKLYNREIKNWSQLVGQLGLSDMLGRPQFAQRVKRWMHKYKIDYYFDYLMGTPFDFFSEDEKYSGCLLMGNYQKRKELGDWSIGSGDDLQQLPPATKKRRRKLVATLSSLSDQQATGEGDGQSSSGDASQRPILMAGSRKRMRGDTQQSSLLLVDKQRTDDTDDDDGDDIDDDDEMHGIDDNRHMNHGSDDEDDVNAVDQESGTENDDNLNNQDDDGPAHANRGIQPVVRKRNLEKEMDEDEEDELASTSSTSGSPIQSPTLSLLDLPSSPSSLNDKSNNTNATIMNTTYSSLSPSTSSSPITTDATSLDQKWATETARSSTLIDSSPSTISFNLFDPIPRITANSTATHSTSPSSSSSPSSPPIPAASVIHRPTTDNTCTSCDQLASTVADLQTKVSMITQHMDTFISKWKPMMESRCKSLQQQVDTLTDENEKMHAQWMLWRKNLVNGLLEDPFQ